MQMCCHESFQVVYSTLFEIWLWNHSGYELSALLHSNILSWKVPILLHTKNIFLSLMHVSVSFVSEVKIDLSNKLKRKKNENLGFHLFPSPLYLLLLEKARLIAAKIHFLHRKAQFWPSIYYSLRNSYAVM